MEDVKIQAGDFLIYEDIESYEEEKIIITFVDYEKDIIKYKSEKNFNKEFSDNISFVSRTPFYRKYKILVVDDYDDLLYAKLSVFENLQIGDYFLEINSLTNEDEFILKEDSSTYHQILKELEKDSDEITIQMSHFHIGYAILNGRKFKGYIDT
jgi:hypothetical protein